ncbi:hypothetical protein [Paraherbaspirillum soli]|uniref:Uncharacterized protein n=1 Tax=Paraherbaspirillum soli TaxID=631222 RepID=A0ABW0M445_9BURK
MENVYEPDNNDVLEWVADKGDGWPAGDWDYYVMNGKNDDLVFELANDLTCPKRDFFLHSLYYLVGDFINERRVNEGKINEAKHRRIFRLIDMVDDQSVEDVKEWRDRAVKIFSCDDEFDPHFWMNYMFWKSE